ncbi:hypothetical protein D3C73_1111700 [compost metagenome]
MHRHEGFIDQRVAGFGVLQGTGDGQHAVTATQIGDPCAAEVLRQVRQEGSCADVQAFTAEHVGVIEQFDRRIIQSITARVGGLDGGFGLSRGDQQPGFFYRQRGLHRANIALQQIAGRTRQMLDHCSGNHLGAGRQLALQADQLFFQ